MHDETPDSPNSQPDWRERPVTLTTTERYGAFALIGIVALVTGVLLGARWFGEGDNALGYFTNIYTDFLNVILTFGILALFFEIRRIQLLKGELVRKAGSRVNAIAVHAVENLRDQKWLEGKNGLLKKAKLGGANLAGAELWGANLQGANLSRANLQGAGLNKANLSGVSFNEVNLTDASLQEANLQGAQIIQANFKGADLRDANLSGATIMGGSFSGADLWHANLEGVHFSYRNRTFDGMTTMPNGTKWDSHTDLKRFTDPNHQDFCDFSKTKEGD